MVKQTRLNAQEAERLLFKQNFQLIRSKGSHRIYQKNMHRVVVPFHKGKILHPKVVKQILKAVEISK